MGSRSSVLPAAGAAAALARSVALWAASFVRSAPLATACLAPSYICGGGGEGGGGQAGRT